MDILMKWHVPSACLPCFLSSLIAALATLVLSFPSLCLSLIDQFLLFLNLYLCPRCLRLIASILLYCFWVKCWFLCKAHGNLLCWSVCCRSKRNSIQFAGHPLSLSEGLPSSDLPIGSGMVWTVTTTRSPSMRDRHFFDGRSCSKRLRKTTLRGSEKC